jgi:hypothetical protein
VCLECARTEMLKQVLFVIIIIYIQSYFNYRKITCEKVNEKKICYGSIKQHDGHCHWSIASSIYSPSCQSSFPGTCKEILTNDEGACSSSLKVYKFEGDYGRGCQMGESGCVSNEMFQCNNFVLNNDKSNIYNCYGYGDDEACFWNGEIKGFFFTHLSVSFLNSFCRTTRYEHRCLLEQV